MPPDCVCTRICHHIDHLFLPNSVYVQPNPSPIQRFKKTENKLPMVMPYGWLWGGYGWLLVIIGGYV